MPDSTLPTISPSQFIVRRDTYEQMQGFPEAAAEVTQQLLMQSPQHFSQAYRFLTEKIRVSPILNRDWHINREAFAIPRFRGDDPFTVFAGKYQQDAIELKKRFPSGRSRVAHKTRWVNDPIDLFAADVPEGSDPRIEHPPTDDDDFMSEHRWSAISQCFQAALNDQNAPEVRKRASLECYALLSADCPYIRGSALLSRIVLEYLAHKAEFAVPLAKVDVDINTKAISRPVDDFIREWEQGDYFDTHVTSEQVMNWHTSRLITQRPTGLSK